MSKCTIRFDQNEHGTYFTGQTITGRIFVTMHKAKKLKGIKLQISGYACAQWRDRHGKARPHPNNKRKKHCFYGREDYIASTTFLAGSEHGEQFLMDAGTHTYTFACPIPANCPSSFEGAFGHIRYLTKVTFMRSGASNRTHNVGFTVLKLLDLNQESRLLKAPANNEAIENFCFNHTKSIQLKVDLAQSGYVPGQMMLVSAYVNNQSGFDCHKLAIFLNLRATYTSDTPMLRTVSEKICLVKKYCGPVPRYQSKNYAETLRIPATPPTCEHLSKIVRVSYEVCVTAIMNTLMVNPKTVIPITIGNVPLTFVSSSAANPNPIPRPDDVPTTSSCAMEIAGGNAHNLLSEEITTEAEMELPPPTYEQAMFMTTDIADDDDDANTVSDAVQFTPRYPVYDVDAMIAAAVPDTGAPVKPKKRKKKTKPVEMEKEPVESPVQI